MYIFAVLVSTFLFAANALREQRAYSNRTQCAMARQINWPFAYSKYPGQILEYQGRVNTNLQDFRHRCSYEGGRSKCHICEEIPCLSTRGNCSLQLQGVKSIDMSINIPTLSDFAWAVGGSHRTDYGGKGVTHYCVLIRGENCTHPSVTNLANCNTRCFGYGFSPSIPPVPRHVAPRSIIDIYPGQFKWSEDGLVDLWEYPRNCTDVNEAGGTCTYSGPHRATPSFNPQGYTFTLAGSGVAGWRDGPPTTAQFNFPQGIAVDKYGNVFVADTLNHAVRLVFPNGTVLTIAGKGPSNPGYTDGQCRFATFSSPKGIDVRYIKDKITGHEVLIIVVSDTNNHRIRQIRYVRSTGDCRVSCLTGLCGNSTLSETLFKSKATPHSGFNDGPGLYARFSAPQGITFIDDGYMVVADTGNYLIRLVSDNGTTWTLAGSLGEAQVEIVDAPTSAPAKGRNSAMKQSGSSQKSKTIALPYPGCPPPCLRGIPGHRDGNLTYAQFLNPTDVSRGGNNSIYVTDEQRIRIVELPNIKTWLYGVRSGGRVSTIAGTALQGYEDGIGQEATFFDPTSIVVTNDNIAYVADSATCRIRRITPSPLVAQQLSCVDDAVAVIRPSGCISFDQPIDAIGRKISRVERNIQYNYAAPYASTPEIPYAQAPGRDAALNRGKYMKNCVGSPPFDRLTKHFVLVQGDNLVIDDNVTFINEDSEQGMTILVRCPAGCATKKSILEGTKWYSDRSSICRAAIHSGQLANSTGGMVQITLERRAYLWDSALSQFTHGSTKNNVTSNSIPESVPRVFKVDFVKDSINIVHSVAGHPSAPLESECKFGDAQPAQSAYFNKPRGVAAYVGSNLTDTVMLYVADTGNHRIRCVSAVCTMICENGGRCVGPDKCACPTGWTGVDCAIPICSTPCGANKVCVAPNTCSCKPGFGGTGCTTPLCVQNCLNGGVCSAPDTCTCRPGWFDANCSTPVCAQTCANGGNCTGPNTCSCPNDWRSFDCRKPVCRQKCLNGGYCMAPDTCKCPPQWSNFDCSIPVCHQGFFKPNPSTIPRHLYASSLGFWETYKPCDMARFCNSTNEFDCYQTALTYNAIEVPNGPFHRKKTGRIKPPIACMPMEFPVNYKTGWEILKSDGNTTGYWRYTPFTNYTSDPRNPWRGYFYPTIGHSAPWKYIPDRQVALVQWVNMSQGVYVCANEGNCTAPDVCECAPGWMGFDCRTPVCNQGYFFKNQPKYVSGLEAYQELDWFKAFMKPNPFPLRWPYSNPNYDIEVEAYFNQTVLNRFISTKGGVRYFGPSNWASGSHDTTNQGGYRCSVRSYTHWENVHYLYQHPNYYSHYMDKGKQHDGKYYNYWINMNWPAVYSKSRVLVKKFANATFIYTNEGFRLYGIWNRTGNVWEYGTCLLEFKRNCSDHRKTLDLQSGLYGVYVQDTDLSYRPRLRYSDKRVLGRGWWETTGGECVNEVVRGCFNNGTCVAPNSCLCATGWTGYDCSIPVCEQTCHHHGNCTLPNTCTCERGWTGYDCSIAMCAQECQNGGKCVAPDTCKCFQWPNEFLDGRTYPRPFFQLPNGDAQLTGWTGYDCGVPICVQGYFLPIVAGVPRTSPRYVETFGHGGDGLLQCISSEGHKIPRCVQYDFRVLSNSGTSFQTGCGHDPLDDGCCVFTDKSQTKVACYKCPTESVVVTPHSMYCTSEPYVKTGPLSRSTDEYFAEFVDYQYKFRMCGRNHTPFDFWTGKALYYKDLLYGRGNDIDHSNFNYRSNLTSNRFLCFVQNWTQGDYIDSANFSSTSGMGTRFGLLPGRNVRVNKPNMFGTPGLWPWIGGSAIPGEGIFTCANRGSCIAPDVCTCEDGYDGYDCKIPLCRHLQPSGAVTSCLNGGTCGAKDRCSCVKAHSVLALAHTDAARGLTGWTGSDCSIPICVQGYFDPFCTDLPQAPAGEGCYRCANGGNCTAPDVCQCATGWTGFDCRTPVCEMVATPLIRLQLGTVSEEKIIAFESDPCGVEAVYGRHGWKGYKYTRGNCTQPNQCTCLCYDMYDRHMCDSIGKHCNGPWQDDLVAIRDVLSSRKRTYGYTFGTTACYDGYEGEVDELAQFTSCHMQVYVPSTLELGSSAMIYTFSIVGFFSCVAYYFIRKRLDKKLRMEKIEKRRARRSSEESLLHEEGGAFGHS